MKILNFGSCNIDYVYLLDHIVAAGETQSTLNLSVFPGGKGLNQSIAIARAGQKVFHAGCIGEGGEFLAELMKESGVRTDFVKMVSAKNGHAIIQVNRNGENSIFVHSGSNAMISEEQVDRVLEHFSKSDLLLLQNEINNIDYIIEKAHQKGMRVVLNPSPCNEEILKTDFDKLFCLVLNEHEIKQITKKDDIKACLEHLKTSFPKLRVMLTLGVKGCIWQDEKGQIFCPSFKTEAIDTTGAGDTFTGYFIAGLANGVKIENILKTASLAAAISVTRKGAATSIPRIDEVQKCVNCIETNPDDIKAEILCTKIEAFIKDNLQNASVEELAKSLGYSSVYTGAMVKKVTGSGFKKLLQKKRLEEASHLIKETDLPIDEIIKKTGYENASFFRKIFKEAYGITPLRYRKGESDEKRAFKSPDGEN